MFIRIVQLPKTCDRQRGFTLIELVIVVVILGVLAAVALPRLLNLQDDASLAAVKGVASSMQVAVQSVHQTFKLNGHITRVQNLQGFGDGTVDTNNSGYPIGTNKGNANENIGKGNSGCVSVWNAILESPPSVSTGSGADYQSYRHTGNKFCSYVYRVTGDTGSRTTANLVIRYNSTTGVVDVCGQSSKVPAC